MLEIIALVLLCNANKKNAVKAGKSGGGAVGMTIGLWVGLEILGAFIGGAAGLGMGSYLLALAFAVIGGVISYNVAKKPSANAPAGVPQYGQQPAFNAGMVTCPGCGNQMLAGTAFCPLCGRTADAQTGQQRLAPESVPAPAAPVKPKSCFYVFAVQGPAFGSVSGDVVGEKARKLKDDYEPARGLELKLVRPNMWSARIQNSNTGGMISVSYSFGQFKDGIRGYLAKEGFESAVIEEGITQSEANSLQLSNPMSGVYVMGIPLVVADTPEPEQMQVEVPPAADMPCVHEFKHFTCVKCGERAPKPQLPRKGIRKQNQYTYEDYAANTAEEARHFLEMTDVSAPLYYVMVQTPQGEWGRDKDGLFLSQLCDFQRNLSLRQCDAQTALMPERMQDLQMAANKIADNFLLSVTCGQCGFTWVDGVAYRAKTIVRCPECGCYNLANTENIRFNFM